MDLIAQLAGTLGLEENQAQALAGTVIGGVQSAVADEDPEKAAQIGSAVPELGDWKSTAGSLLGGGDSGGSAAGGLGGMLGGLAGGGGAAGLLGAAAGAFGGQEAKDTVAVVGILNKFDVDAGKAAMVAPLILKFLKSRVDPGTLSTILSVAPMLAGAVGGGGDDGGGDKPAGGLGGMLGGLLG